MKKLFTACGETIFLDNIDYDTAKEYKWVLKSYKNYRYVVTYVKRKGLPYDKGISFKKLILGINSKMTLHKNKNPFDLRRENILVFDSRSDYISTMGKMYKIKRTELNFKASKGAQGRGGKTTKKTTYIGVRYEPKNAHQWSSIIKYNYKNIHLGSFTREEDAALAYDKKAVEIYGSDAIVNFPHLTIDEVTEKLNKIKEEDAILFYDHLSFRHQGKFNKKIIKTSKYVGVSLKKGRGKCWRATIFYHNKQIYLGEYYTEEEAAQAYDKKAIEIYGEKARLNFPPKKAPGKSTDHS